MLLRFFSSVRLTLALLLGLALVSVVGTFNPPAEGRYDVFYQSPWFRLFLGLLALNLAVCTLRTIRRNLADRRTQLELLGGEQVFAGGLRYVLPGGAGVERLAEGLRRSGYRVLTEGEKVLASKGMAGRWGSTVVHLSVLVIMLGALSAELGFVGTLNLYVGDQSAVYFDWAEQQNRPLGFTFRLDAFEPQYYPIELQVAAHEPGTEREIALYTTREGESFELPAPGTVAKVVKFVPTEQLLVLGIYRNGAYLGEYRTAGGRRPAANVVDPGVLLRPAAFRDPLLRQLRSEVSILEEGQVVKQGVIEVNHPLVYKGVAIYQTAFDRDKFGFWSAGFQFTSDPGEAVVWIGCIALMAGLLLAFFVPYRVVGIGRSGGELLLVALSGFRGEAGQKAFDRLERDLCASPGEETPR